MPTYERYVAIGDSTTEGLDDPDGRGGFRGWADRLAMALARANSRLQYANLAIRGRGTRQIRAEQLAPALALAPDLASVVAGTNDLLRPTLDLDAWSRELDAMFAGFRGRGATVVSFTMPDLSAVMPLARLVRGRLAQMNERLRKLAAGHGVKLLDLDRHPVAADPRLWSGDRLHANSLGHERVAAALASLLELPGSDSRWQDALPAMPPFTWRDRLEGELAWGRTHLMPWLVRHARGRSSGDGRRPKRPTLGPAPT